jgi:hypothetical protein
VSTIFISNQTHNFDDMVGVPGKFKGCETCRRRRVKVSLLFSSFLGGGNAVHVSRRRTCRLTRRQCTNERPFCEKCIARGRQCEGYERKRVFITGTPASKGRVASHPKKGVSSKRNSDDEHSQDVRLDVSPSLPLSSAWDDHVSLSVNGVEKSVLMPTLQLKLEDVARSGNTSRPNSSLFQLDTLPYAATDGRAMKGGAVVDTSAQCLLSVEDMDDGESSMGDSYCAFIYEHHYSPSQGTAAEAVANQHEVLRSLGPEHFSLFPNHHFFVKLIRPAVVSQALLSRQLTFLSDHEWITVPWEYHPKSLLDRLFDLMLAIPPIMVSTDNILPEKATLDRRYKTQDLLHSCLTLERQFDDWFAAVTEADAFSSPAYWTENVGGSTASLPFPYPLAFRNGHTGVMLLYYWMSQILLHECINRVNHAIFEPVVGEYPNMWPDLPPSIEIDPARYQQSRGFAVNICRSLEYVLNNTVQPDIVVAPMTVALDLYKEINASSPDAALEILWLESFKGRVTSNGQHIASKLQTQRWTEIARF